MLWLGFPLGIASSAHFSGLGAFFTEMFPTRLRGSGQGFAYNFGRGIGALSVPDTGRLPVRHRGIVHRHRGVRGDGLRAAARCGIAAAGNACKGATGRWLRPCPPTPGRLLPVPVPIRRHPLRLPSGAVTRCMRRHLIAASGTLTGRTDELLDPLADWVPDPVARDLVLVEHPQRLCDFANASAHQTGR